MQLLIIIHSFVVVVDFSEDLPKRRIRGKLLFCFMHFTFNRETKAICEMIKHVEGGGSFSAPGLGVNDPLALY